MKFFYKYQYQLLLKQIWSLDKIHTLTKHTQVTVSYKETKKKKKVEEENFDLFQRKIKYNKIKLIKSKY